MNYFESSMFYPSFSSEDKVRLYSVFGGIPYYNRLIDEDKSIKENLMDLIVSSGSRLEDQIWEHLVTGFSRISNANATLDALAAGYSKYGDILLRSHVSSGPTLIAALEKLSRMEIVVKKAPINDENNKRKSEYYIQDNLSKFYYRYIYRYFSQRSVLSPEGFYHKLIEPDFETEFVPHQFEEIAKRYLIERNRRGEFDPVLEKIGKYYYNDPKNKTSGEFDIESQDEKASFSTR
ncbi:MAG: DUF234 domain-containing protein [Candidatus Enteromonas sp.]